MSYFENAQKQAAALREKECVRILAIESSCDETAAAVVENGRKILSNAVFSQIDLHALYGGEATVNSSHHQGLAEMGTGLRVTAFAPDGVAEAAEHSQLPILTVQFHPERMAAPWARPGMADGAPVFRLFRRMAEQAGA